MWVASPASLAVETVRPGKAATSSSASSLAPALAGEAQTFANVEKPNALIRSSPVTVSGREVLPRKLGEQRSSAYVSGGGCGWSGEGEDCGGALAAGGGASAVILSETS